MAFNLIFIFVIGFLLYYFLKIQNKKENPNKTTDSKNNITEVNEALEEKKEKKNSLEATYKVKEGESLFLFNQMN